MKSEDYILSESEIDEFDQLYDGTISEENYYVLMAKLKVDEVLQLKFLVYKLLRKEIEQDGLANKILKQRFTAIDQNLRKKKFRLFSILSSVLLVAIITFLFTFKSKNIKIYEKYKDTESGISIRMNNVNRSLLDSAMIEIAKGEYAHAKSYLNKLSATDTTIYFKAYCDERLGKYEEASHVYENLLQSSANIIQQKSTFRLALLKLRSGDKKALIDLKLIAADPENLYKRTAKEIIESMGK